MADDDLPRFPFSARGDEVAAQYRELPPVTRVRTNTGDVAWLVTGYDAARAVLGDARFSHSETARPGVPRQDTPTVPPEIITSMEVARSVGVRSEIMRALGPAAVEELRPLARATAGELLDGLVRSGPPADLFADFVAPLPTRVACAMAGLPFEDADTLDTWGQVGTSMSVHTPEELRASYEEYCAYLLVQTRAPRDGLLQRVHDVAVRSEIDVEQAVILAGAMFIVAQSTVGVLAHAVLTLLRDPGLMRRLHEDPALMPSAVEEFLRYALWVHDGIPRIATADVEVEGTPIRAGELVLLSLDIANRDPCAFAAPDRFDPARTPNPHLAFGLGHHYCPGTGFARMEMTEALSALVERLPDARLDGLAGRLDWHSALTIRRPVRIPARW
ncbi:cytochrome P450 [Actinomadura harenae]|uniref:cytochrome P450 n=1 Tax=Actinomadura harenae TaxID=2483351 RepID=UPI0011C463E3|nr:cytochrome P450 [Actinomadura harenae]